MIKYFQLILVCSISLGYSQRNTTNFSFRKFVKKFNISAEVGFYRPEYYYTGDLTAIDPFPYPVITPYPKIRLGYSLSPKLSVEYAYTSLHYGGYHGFRGQFTPLLQYSNFGIAFYAYCHDLGVRYYFKSFSNSRKTIFLSWNPSLVFENYENTLNSNGYAMSSTFKDSLAERQLVLSSIFIRNEFFIEFYRKSNRISWGLGMAYKFNPFFKPIVEMDIYYETDGKKRQAYNYSYGNGFCLLFLRFTFYGSDKKPIVSQYFFSE